MSPKKASATASPSKITSGDIRSAKERSAIKTAGANAPLPTTKRKLERETVVVSSDSEIEIVEQPTPAKKKRVYTTPSPKSQAYKELPAVSVSGVLSLVLAAMNAAGANSPTFGSLGHREASTKVVKQDGARPERLKIKTEKAMYAEKEGVDASPVKRKGKGKEAPQVVEARDATPEMSDIEWPLTPVRSIKLEEREDHVGLTDQDQDQDQEVSKDGETLAEEVSDCDGPNESGDSVSAELEEEDPLMEVMLKSIQDPELAPIYEGLPELGIYRTVRQYSYVSTVGMGVVILKDIQNRMGSDDLSRLVRALLFTKSGIFVNPARVAPDVFVAELGRLKLRETSSTMAVCIMTGIVTDCSIIAEGWTGGPDNEKAVHKISIAPFRQDFRRDTTMWGKILNFDNISCAISTEGVSFTTKPRTLSAPVFSSAVPNSSPKTPKKGSRALTVVLSPAPARRADNFITSRSFEQQVPIYDGRSVKGAREFNFSDEAFSKLATWPLYKKGVEDLPFDAVVSVGYTLNTFGEGPRGGPNGLSTNLHFVILIALPDSVDA